MSPSLSLEAAAEGGAMDILTIGGERGGVERPPPPPDRGDERSASSPAAPVAGKRGGATASSPVSRRREARPSMSRRGRRSEGCSGGRDREIGIRWRIPTMEEDLDFHPPHIQCPPVPVSLILVTLVMER